MVGGAAACASPLLASLTRFLLPAVHPHLPACPPQVESVLSQVLAGRTLLLLF